MEKVHKDQNRAGKVGWMYLTFPLLPKEPHEYHNIVHKLTEFTDGESSEEN